MSTHTPQQERCTDNIKEEVRELRDETEELADAISRETADPAAVAQTIRNVAALSVTIEDSAADVIDGESNAWRAIEELQAALFHAAELVKIEESDGEIIAPTDRRTRSEAILTATSGAEYIEQAIENK